ncbi:MAG: hypothetical protein US50_C0002G0008 [Candidatus Nomurabacteria bacterium GW2011_GWB1_37_5]|uniref:Uncharacterized protein n=1 Tax=Candidatus Nomurabacteria bacterium GW2011_GWB1_37_5 TaxID=1618742 RepID=A0A0G0GY78_9BACT|nr:MAG: hypothetical protein US50_C0002G0008 [Candidatus Nomurabacteria bacterium GW2011_GWB1_37_5]
MFKGNKSTLEEQLKGKSPEEIEKWKKDREEALNKHDAKPKSFVLGSGGTPIPKEEMTDEEREALKERTKENRQD